MTQPEFDAVTALAHVREIRAHLEALDPHAGTIIKDEETHAAMRRTIRAWDAVIVQKISIRKQRSDAQTSLPLEKPIKKHLNVCASHQGLLCNCSEKP